MRHKFYLCLITILLLTFASTISAQEKEIRYITGHIENVDDNLIILSGNLAFRANEHVTAINMTPATFVLGYDRPEGFVFIKNRKVDVVLMKSSGGKFIVPASKEDLTMYNDGTLNEIKKITKSTGYLTLSSGRQFTL